MGQSSYRTRAFAVLAVAGSLLVVLLGNSATSIAAECPNDAIRESQASEATPLGSAYLPGCMAFEMVSPPGHFGQETREISAFSYDGTRARFRSKAALANTPGLQAFAGDTYVATRGANGWGSSPTSAPASAQIVGGIDPLQGGPFALAPDLGSWALFGATQAQVFSGEGQFFHGDLNGTFESLSPLLIANDNEIGLSNIYVFDAQMRPLATAADLTSTVFPAPAGRTTTFYLPNDPSSNAAVNSYVAFIDAAGTPQVQLLARDDAGRVWGGRCGARVGGASVQGAVSPDGDRIFFTSRPGQPASSPAEEAEGKYPPCSDTSDTTNPQRILVRDQGAAGDQAHIAPLIPGGPAAGSDTFRAASADGRMVYLTTSRQLVTGDADSTSDLYLYDFSRPEADRLIQVSAGEDVGSEHEAGKDANVASLVALSTDGSHVYFTAKGVLTGQMNPVGGGAVQGQENLYLYDALTGVTSFIGVLGAGETSLSAQAVPMLREPGSAAEGGDGHILALVSQATLAPAEDGDSGRADAYRYDADAKTLVCLSCVAPLPDTAPFDVAAGSGSSTVEVTRQGLPNFAEQGRWISEDGQVAALATAEPLEAGDEDGEINPYLRVGDRLARLPGTVPAGASSQNYMPTVSLDGGEVGFTTAQALLPQDTDTARDAYVARVLGGFPNPSISAPCNPLLSGSCEGPGTSAGGNPPAASEAFRGDGNVRQRPPCAKGKQRNKKGRCVVRKQHRRHHSSHHRKTQKTQHEKAAKRSRGGNR